ncbi:FAD-binding protein [Pseudomonas sp. CBSPGW29]|nr:FAD-binding protein [Pseudomonas sp. CBSPGW29]
MNQDFDADVIVVGSGALGSNAAFELAKLGKSVIILEAGEHIPRWKIVENFRNSSNKGNYNSPYPNEPWPIILMMSNTSRTPVLSSFAPAC